MSTAEHARVIANRRAAEARYDIQAPDPKMLDGIWLTNDGVLHRETDAQAPAIQAPEVVLSVKRSEWEALSPEAQDKLLKITGAASRNLSRAQAAADMLDKPLCTQPPEGWTCSRGAGHEGPCASSPAIQAPEAVDWHRNYVAVEKGALQMVRSILWRDAEAGRIVRGEALEALKVATREIPALATPSAAVSAAEPVAVYLVATGETVDGQETYTRHEGSPPPMCDFERLYAPAPAPTQPQQGTGSGKP